MAKKTQNDLENSEPVPDSSPEWPCKPIAECSGWATKWPTPTIYSNFQTPLPTPEDEEANKGQLQALLKVSEYLNSTQCLDDDDSDEEGEDYDFFVKLFKQDEGLKEYYEKNKENGVFCCLVCCGVKEKGWKRFKNCATLVQHAVAIAKTKKRRAHRAYCQVVCEILGWDVNRLPSIVLSAGDKLVEAEGNVDDDGEDSLCGQFKTTSITEVSLSKETFINENQEGKCGGSTVLEHNSPSEAAANRSLGDLSKGVPRTTKENTEGVFDDLEKSLSKASADGLLEAVSFTTPDTLKGTAEGASKCVEPPKECPVIANEEKGCQKDDDVQKNLEDVNQELQALIIQ